MQPMRQRSYKMSRAYKLKIDDSGAIEYLEGDEVLEDIYDCLERIENIMSDVRAALDTRDNCVPADKDIKF